MVRALATTLLAAATLTACASERDLNAYDENRYQNTQQDQFIAEFAEWSNLDVRDASTFGSMGPVNDIGGIAAATGYRDAEAGYEYTEVTVVTSNNEGSSMHMLYIEGDLNQLERGRKYTFNGNGYDNATTVYAASTNCSGTGDPGVWDYDVGAEEVSVTVEDTADGDTLVQYETISTDSLFGADVSGGEFVLPAQELPAEEF